MKHQILGTLFLAAAIVACGGSDAGNNGGSDGGIVFVDAAAPDAAVAACNPLSNTGCQPGEKCTYVIDTPQGADDPLGSTRCAPDGNKQAGEECVRSVAGNPDDCVGTTYCRRSICYPLCSSDPDTCEMGNGVCIHASGIFEDNDSIGFCSGPPCDLFAQDCPNPHRDDEVMDTESCYLLWFRPNAPTGCFSAVAEPGSGNEEPGGQDVDCNFINTCAKGYGCDKPATPPVEGEQVSQMACAKYCDAAGTSGARCLRPNDACYSYTYYWSNANDVPENIGFCADHDEFGPTGYERLDAGMME